MIQSYNNKYLMVLSGGMDSVTMLHEFKDQIDAAVFFNYGSNHNLRERECARYHCAQLDIRLIEIELDFIAQHFDSSLLSGADSIPDGHYADDNMKSTVVPFRNGIMLSIAAGIAESRHLAGVMIANHAGDHSIYPDCRPGFIKAMSDAIEAGTYEGLTINAPYTNLTKGQIASHGKKIGVDYRHTYSCYKGREKQCGTCGTCVERREALTEAGFHPDYITECF